MFTQDSSQSSPSESSPSHSTSTSNGRPRRPSCRRTAITRLTAHRPDPHHPPPDRRVVIPRPYRPSRWRSARSVRRASRSLTGSGSFRSVISSWPVACLRPAMYNHCRGPTRDHTRLSRLEASTLRFDHGSLRSLKHPPKPTRNTQHVSGATAEWESGRERGERSRGCDPWVCGLLIACC